MKNSPMMIVGILLIVVGVALLGWQGITYTTKETVVDAGPIKVTADKEKTIPFSPIVGAVALAGGVALVVAGRKG
jgi:drug/metabolite transporter (DMT)-like permease